MLNTTKIAFIWVTESESQDPACSLTDASDILHLYKAKSVKGIGMGHQLLSPTKPSLRLLVKGQLLPKMYQQSRTKEYQMGTL